MIYKLKNSKHQLIGDMLIYSIISETVFYFFNQNFTTKFFLQFPVLNFWIICFKLILRKPRPNNKNNYSLPSGHTCNSLFITFFSLQHRKTMVNFLKIPISIYIIYSRIKSRNHSKIDISFSIILLITYYKFVNEKIYKYLKQNLLNGN